MEVKRLNQLIVSQSYGGDKTYKDLITIEKDDSNKIETVHFNMLLLNQLSSSIADDIMATYHSIEEGTYKAKDESYYEKRIEEVSKKGILSKVPLFNSIIPVTIPIKFEQVSYIGSNIKKNVKNYGLNHIMIEICIEININLVMIYPFYKEYKPFKFEVPVLLELYEGQVPKTYYSQGGI